MKYLFFFLFFSFTALTGHDLPVETVLDRPVIISMSDLFERYEETARLMRRAGFTRIRYYEAINGSETSPSFFKKLNIHDKRPGRRGCAASHLTLWKVFLDQMPDREYLFVCEDDMLPHSQFAKLFPRYWKETPQDFDIVLVGNYFPQGIYTDKLLVAVPAITTHAYIISKNGARLLLETYAKIPKNSPEQDYIIDNHIYKMMEQKKINYICYNGKRFPDVENRERMQKKSDTGICFQNAAFESTIAGKNLKQRFLNLF